MNKATELVLCGAIFFVAGCVEQTSYGTIEQSGEVVAHLLRQQPTKMDQRLDVSFDGMVTLLGYDLKQKSDPVAPGDQVEVIWYWRCDEPTGPGWKLFTHVVDAKGSSRINRDNEGPTHTATDALIWGWASYPSSRKSSKQKSSSPRTAGFRIIRGRGPGSLFS